MTTGEKWFLGSFLAIAAIAIGYIIGVQRGWWRDVFAPKSPEDNIPSEGASCILPNGEMGTIQNRVCVSLQPEPRPNIITRVRVINPNGAPVYLVQNGNFLAPASPQIIPVNTELNVRSSAGKPIVYYETNSGWIYSGDVQPII